VAEVGVRTVRARAASPVERVIFVTVGARATAAFTAVV